MILIVAVEELWQLKELILVIMAVDHDLERVRIGKVRGCVSLSINLDKELLLFIHIEEANSYNSNIVSSSNYKLAISCIDVLASSWLGFTFIDALYLNWLLRVIRLVDRADISVDTALILYLPEEGLITNFDCKQYSKLVLFSSREVFSNYCDDVIPWYSML